MSFWGKLGHGLLKIAPIAGMAIPGVGPVLGGILGAAGTIGSAAAGAAKGRAQGRQAEAALQQQQDQLALERAKQQQQQINDALTQQLAQKQYQQQATTLNQQRAVKGGLLQGLQDVHINVPSNIPMAQISGGLRPSAFTGKEQIGADMQRQAQMALMNGENLSPITSAPLPELTPLPQAGKVDTGLDWMGLIGSLVGGFGGQQTPGMPRDPLQGLDPRFLQGGQVPPILPPGRAPSLAPMR